MYGAGKLLLKDTVLEMKANRRYGVVGHNGAFEVVELSSSCRLWFLFVFFKPRSGGKRMGQHCGGLLGKAATHVQGYCHLPSHFTRDSRWLNA